MDFRGIYHVYNRSIARYVIFNTQEAYERMVQLIAYYQIKKPKLSFSYLKKMEHEEKLRTCIEMLRAEDSEKIVTVIAYCLMPTHIHLVLEELVDGGISKYMSNVLNSYTKYFNARNHRHGPLWEGRSKRKEVETDEYLAHLTRYVHINPVVAGLIVNAEEWRHSSYNEFLGIVRNEIAVCDFNEFMEVEAEEYRVFVNDRTDYQESVHNIEHLLFEE